MGNSSSSAGRAHGADDTVDYGYLVPAGVYTGPRDWNQPIVAQFICARRLAPFYRPLEDYEESWDDDRILAARKEFPDQDSSSPPEPVSRVETASSSHSSKGSLSKRTGALKEISKPEAAIYRGAVECPICFLYYPPNINHSRCCDQAICTECFVQIKRSEPTTTHLVSEPAACPYCVQENFGVVYKPPTWRSGMGSEGASSIFADSPRGDGAAPYPTHKRRQKSFGHDSPEVVTTDQIRPDWEAKLAAVRAAVTRRANRRIIMRQVGDRLIPVGVTSGRIHTGAPDDGQTEGSDQQGGSRRRRRHQQQPNGQTFDQFLGAMNMGGPDLEELMVMEAMRLSLIEHEEQQRKEAEEKKKNANAKPSTEETPPAAGSPVQTTDPAPGSSNAHPTASNTSLHQPSLPIPAVADTPSPIPASSTSSPVTATFDRQANPPPFSTMHAAIATASTASALLAQSSTSLPSPTADSGETTTPTPDANINTETASSPTVPEDANPLPSGAGSDAASVSSSVVSPLATPSYNILPSSPLSTPDNADQQPLIPETSKTSTETGNTTNSQ